MGGTKNADPKESIWPPQGAHEYSSYGLEGYHIPWPPTIVVAML